MSYGMLRNEEAQRPLMVFHEDWERIRAAIMQGDEEPNRAFFTDGLVDSTEASLSVRDGKLYLAAMPSGLFYDGVFARDEGERELTIEPSYRSELGNYFIYAKIVSGTESEEFPNDRYTITHNYDKEDIVVSFTVYQGSGKGIRLGKIAIEGDSIRILDTERDQSYLKPRYIQSIISYLDTDQFAEGADGKVSLRSIIRHLNPSQFVEDSRGIVSFREDSEEESVNFIDKGLFPYFFGMVDLSGSTLKILPPVGSNQPGHFKFAGGKVFIFDRVYELPEYEGYIGELHFNFDSSDNITIAEGTVPLSSLANIGQPFDIVFALEISYTIDSSSAIAMTSLKLKTMLEEDFVGIDSTEELESSPFMIKLATFSSASDWLINADRIAFSPLIEQFNVLELDCTEVSNFKFLPMCDYILRLKNYYANQDITVETSGNGGLYNASRWESELDGEYHNIEQAFNFVKDSTNEKEILRVHSDSDKSLSVMSLLHLSYEGDLSQLQTSYEGDLSQLQTSLQELEELREGDLAESEVLHAKDWTQKAGMAIGRIHGELVEPDDALSEFPLSLPCNASYIYISSYPLYADWAAPVNASGTRVLTSLATRLGISLSGTTRIKLPDFTNEPFPRFVLSSVGRYQDDAFESHTHSYNKPSRYSFSESGTSTTHSVGSQSGVGSNTGSSGSTETRPKNRGFYPLIKVR